MDVRSLMRRSAMFNQHREAVVAGDRRLTYGEAWDRAVRLANGLLDFGLQAGDRIGVLEDNTVEAQDVFAGAAAANLVRVPLYARNSLEAHAHMLDHTQVKVLIVAERYAAGVAHLVDELPHLEHILVRDEGYEKWLGEQSDVDPDPFISPDDYFIIRHSGGTTGRPKGVGYTHRSWLAAGRDWFYNFPPVQLGDACLHLGPISHGSGYLYTPIWLSGGRNVLLEEFDPELVLSTMESERIAYAFMVPTMLNLLVRHPSARSRDWSNLKVIQLGGSPVADATALLARDIFGMVLYQGYGQTEALPVCMMGPQEWFSDLEGSEPLRSAGRPLPFADLEIRDDDNRPVPIGVEGEIAIRCDGQMPGFWQDDELTASRLVDGWVLTGDIGKFDENGYVYVLDRKDDMIISGGFNIWPAELENVILDHPDVVEVAVVGVPHPRWGETPLAICVVRPDATVTAADIQALCGDRLGSYKKPSEVVFRTDVLPKSPVGKLQRKVLRAPYWANATRMVSG